MTHRLATNYAKNCRNRTPIVEVIVENVVTCFFGTQCTKSADQGSRIRSVRTLFFDRYVRMLTYSISAYAYTRMQMLCPEI